LMLLAGFSGDDWGTCGNEAVKCEKEGNEGAGDRIWDTEDLGVGNSGGIGSIFKEEVGLVFVQCAIC
jgi:hypothetical protein